MTQASPRRWHGLLLLSSLAACGPVGVEETNSDPESLSGCSFSVTTNQYDAPNYWGTITIKNGASTSTAGFTVDFDVPRGAHCTNDVVPSGATLSPLTGSGTSAHTTSNHCTFTWSATLAGGASKTFNYSTDSTAFKAATAVTVNSSSCGSNGTGGSSGAGGSGGIGAGGAAGGGGSGGAGAGGGGSGGSGAGGAAGGGGYVGCGGPSPTEGFTQYTDTFKVQHPYDVPEADRFTFQNGVYTTWVYQGDKAYSPGSPTGPRTEMRWSQNWSTGERIWEADVMYDSPSTHTCIMQVKGNVAGATIYLQVNGGKLRNSIHEDFLAPSYGQWMNIKSAYNPDTGLVRVWVNNCLKYTTTDKRSDEWYFKNGIYGCDTARCTAHFKNIKLWKK